MFNNILRKEKKKKKNRKKERKKRESETRRGLLQHYETISARISPEEYYTRFLRTSPPSFFSLRGFRLACSAFSKEGRFKRRVAPRKDAKIRWQRFTSSLAGLANDAKRFALDVKRRPRASKKEFYSRDATRLFLLSMPLLLATGHSDCEER